MLGETIEIKSVHYLMGGKTACGFGDGKRPTNWVQGHMWDIYWKNVTCKECLKHKPKVSTDEM